MKKSIYVPLYYKYLLIAFFWSFVVFSFTPQKALDITRYYSTIYVYHGTVLDLLRESVYRNYDFIYIVSLKIAYDIGIPLNVLTSLYVSFFLIFSLKIVQEVMRKVGVYRIPDIVVLSVNTIAPFVWLISVSRSTAAFCFFFYAVLKNCKKDYIRAMVFFTLSALTHISMIIFIAIFIAGIILSPLIKRIGSQRMILIFGLSVLLTIYLGNIISDFFIMLSASELEESRYSIYFSDFEGGFSTNFLLNSTIPKSQRIQLFSIIILNILLLVLDKIKDKFTSVLLLGEILLIFFTFSIPHMVFRMILFMVPFVVISLCRIYCLSPKKRETIKYCVIILTLFQLLGFYNERISFF